MCLSSYYHLFLQLSPAHPVFQQVPYDSALQGVPNYFIEAVRSTLQLEDMSAVPGIGTFRTVVKNTFPIHLVCKSFLC